GRPLHRAFHATSGRQDNVPRGRCGDNAPTDSTRCRSPGSRVVRPPSPCPRPSARSSPATLPPGRGNSGREGKAESATVIEHVVVPVTDSLGEQCARLTERSRNEEREHQVFHGPPPNECRWHPRPVSLPGGKRASRRVK